MNITVAQGHTAVWVAGTGGVDETPLLAIGKH